MTAPVVCNLTKQSIQCWSSFFHELYVHGFSQCYLHNMCDSDLAHMKSYAALLNILTQHRDCTYFKAKVFSIKYIFYCCFASE